VRNSEFKTLRLQNEEFASEIGVIDGRNKDSIYVRPLMAKGGFNSWRFRIQKPSQDFEYCMGIVNCTQLGKPIIPSQSQGYFHVIESDVAQETEVAVSLWRGAESRWFVAFQEFQGAASKAPSATRLDVFPDEIMSQVLQIQNGMIQNKLSLQSLGTQENGSISEHARDETVSLVLSAALQPMDYRRAFVVVLRRRTDREE
jgi:hypothetical protein